MTPQSTVQPETGHECIKIGALLKKLSSFPSDNKNNNILKKKNTSSCKNHYTEKLKLKLTTVKKKPINSSIY